MELAGLTNVDYDYLNTFMSVNLMEPCTAPGRSCARWASRRARTNAGAGRSSTSPRRLRGWASAASTAWAKAGLNFLTASLAHELGHRNIRINAVAPGPPTRRR